MKIEDSLVKISRKHAKARADLAAVEAERDHIIRQAHQNGGLTVRQIAGLVGMSHQRVGQIVAQD